MPHPRPRPILVRPHPAHPAAVAPLRVDPSGRRGPTPKQARGPGWRWTATNLYVPAEVDATLTVQRIVEAAAVLPAHGGVTGWAALSWSGARWFDGVGADGSPLRVPLAIGGNLRPDALRAPSKEGLPPLDLTTEDGLAVTTAPRSVCFEMRYAADWRAAVVAADMAAQADLVSLSEAGRYVVERLTSWTGVGQARLALRHADENSWSPMESEMRLRWTVDASLARPLTNRPVFDLDGYHLGTPDLLDPRCGVVGEYDGALHLDGERRHRDLKREERFRAAGLEVVTMVAADRREPGAFLDRLRSAYARAALRPAELRRYTLDLPPGWAPRDTVERRRALRAAEAAAGDWGALPG